MVDAYTRRKFETLVAAAFADGYLASSEKDILSRKAALLQISNREMHEIFALGEARKLTIALPGTTLERDQLLEELIDVVCSDGRIEPPEYALLARFAEHLKIAMPDLRQRVNRRMQESSKGNTQKQSRPPAPPPARTTQARPAPPPASRPAPRAPQPPALPPPAFEAPKFPGPPSTAPAPGPVQLESAFPHQPKVADLPPVTLHLLRQSIMFDSEADSIANISRTLGVPPSEATDIRAAIIAAFPDLRPGRS